MKFSFFSVLRSEWLKQRRTAVFWLIVVGAIFIPAINFIGAYVDRETLAAQVLSDRFWHAQFLLSWKPMAIFLLPLGIILATSLITQIEYRNNAWKQVHTAPVSYFSTFTAKFTVLVGLFLLYFVLFNIGIVIAAILPVWFSSELTLREQPFPWAVYLTGNLKFFTASIPILALQFVLGLRIKNFMIPMGIGIILFVCNLFAVSQPINYLFPYDYVTMQYLTFVDPVFPHPPVPTYFLGPIVAVTILVVGYFILQARKEKG